MSPVIPIIGIVFALLAIAIVFNPLLVTNGKIQAAPLPTDVRLDSHNFAVQPVTFGVCNIYFIRTSGGNIMVDAGMPNMERQVNVAFEKAGVNPASVQLIIITHGHLDHVGSVAYAKQLTGAELLCHRFCADRLENGQVVPAVARHNLARFMEFMSQLAGSRFRSVAPDILVEDDFDLADYGIAGKVMHTPGHSADSLSIILDTGEALIADMLRGKDDNINIGMFYEDEKALLASLEKVATFRPDIVYLSHGTHINNSELQTAIDTISVGLSI